MVNVDLVDLDPALIVSSTDLAAEFTRGELRGRISVQPSLIDVADLGQPIAVAFDLEVGDWTDAEIRTNATAASPIWMDLGGNAQWLNSAAPMTVRLPPGKVHIRLARSSGSMLVSGLPDSFSLT
ncbi:MAG: hypothetical protein JST35_12330 [Armatimonadetes bacterium]|nr:hypothetical protein [Armatimonadota bacterium]